MRKLLVVATLLAGFGCSHREKVTTPTKADPKYTGVEKEVRDAVEEYFDIIKQGVPYLPTHGSVKRFNAYREHEIVSVVTYNSDTKTTVYDEHGKPLPVTESKSGEVSHECLGTATVKVRVSYSDKTGHPLINDHTFNMIRTGPHAWLVHAID